MAAFKGTFAATGTSDTFSGKMVNIKLTFAGIATVQLQQDILGDGDWQLVKEYTATPDDVITWDAPATSLRLECTEHTDDVDYFIDTCG